MANIITQDILIDFIPLSPISSVTVFSFKIGDMRDETYKIQKELENTHSIVSNIIEPVTIKNDKNSSKMEGYLFKRTSNAFKTWNRRWFYLYDDKLVYR